MNAAIEAVVERVRRTPLGARIPDGWERLEDLPFTVKDDLREHYPLGLLAVDRSRAAPHPRLVGLAREADGRRLHPSTTSTCGRR